MEAEIIDMETNQLIETKVIGRDIPGDFRDGEAIPTKHGPRTIVRAAMETKQVAEGFMMAYYKIWVK